MILHLEGFPRIEKKMLSHVENNYSLTTDLADYISQKSGVGYRLIYKIIGQVIDEAINKGKLLKDIKAKEIIDKASTFDIKLQLFDKEILKAIDPQTILEKRKHIGGSSNQTMNKSLNKVKKEITNIDYWLKNQIKISEKAKEKIEILISNLINNNE